MRNPIATFYCDNEWDFNIVPSDDNQSFYIYPARDHRGMMMDLGRKNRWKLARIHTFDHFPSHDEVKEVTKDWTAVDHFELQLEYGEKYPT